MLNLVVQVETAFARAMQRTLDSDVLIYCTTDPNILMQCALMQSRFVSKQLCVHHLFASAGRELVEPLVDLEHTQMTRPELRRGSKHTRD